jgi:hypothetical protein
MSLQLNNTIPAVAVECTDVGVSAIVELIINCSCSCARKKVNSNIKKTDNNDYDNDVFSQRFYKKMFMVTYIT